MHSFCTEVEGGVEGLEVMAEDVGDGRVRRGSGQGGEARGRVPWPASVDGLPDSLHQVDLLVGKGGGSMGPDGDATGSVDEEVEGSPAIDFVKHHREVGGPWVEVIEGRHPHCQRSAIGR
ncbi:hypothetical protein COCNU_02G009410 [Cocos nucifera]|uniref:Uncharacterized protein n=1 Tax=Cocos nucifera TaxID=13894 RepID=A0A8K0I012_COCNU|nr:hypothetical protein COCNU_02G009410 [Cocos nucifera]